MFHDKRWICSSPEEERVKQLAKAMDITPILAATLINRGINTKDQGERFLHPRYSDLSDPFLMPDIEVSVERIISAVKRGERICIYGDYDVDGITSVSFLMRVLNALGGTDTIYYIPDRIEEGYGLNARAVADIYKAGVGLIITVDCGIASHDEISLCNEYGMDVVVTDHHLLCQRGLPPAVGIINPHRSDSKYPFNDLAGVGVVYKLCVALERTLQDRGMHIGKARGAFLSDEMLDLVALGTIADIVPLTGENRVLVSLGLKQMQDTNNIGLKALMNVSGTDDGLISAGQVAFRLAPRLNAAGRISHAGKGVKLLMEDSRERAVLLAKELDIKNRERQEIGSNIYEQAVEMAKKNAGDSVLVLGSEKWHPGVLGIAASRIVEKFNKPAILFQIGGDEARGSARGVPGLDLYRLLSRFKHYYKSFGGHKQAAGLTVKSEDLGKFAREINSVSLEAVKELEVKGTLNAEADLTGIDINLRDVEELELLEPCGYGNPYPLFVKRHIKVNRLQRVGKGGGHLKLIAVEGNKRFSGIAFRWEAPGWPVTNQRADIIFSPSINRWLGKTELQLVLKDIRGISKEEAFLRGWYRSLKGLNDYNKALCKSMARQPRLKVQNIKGNSTFLRDVFLNSTGNLLFLNGYERVLADVSALSLYPNTEVSFGCLKEYSEDKNFIIIHPFSFKNMKDCKGRLYFYARGILPGQLKAIDAMDGVQRVMLTEGDVRRSLSQELLNTLPSRLETASVYRLIRRKKGLTFNVLIRTALRGAVNPAKATLAVEGLKSAGLAEERDGCIFMVPPPGEKKNLDDFPVFNMIKGMADDARDCMDIGANTESR